MKEHKLDNSPISYYLSSKDHNQWILLIHAAFVNHNMFTRQFEYFNDKYNILAIDIIGHGNSITSQREDSIINMSDWIRDILKVQSIEKIHILGISLGSIIAQDFSNKYPEMVKSLACFGGYDINDFDEDSQRENNVNQMLMMAKAIFSIKWFAQSNKKISAYTKQGQEEFYQMNLQFKKKSLSYLASLGDMINVYPKTKRDYPLMIGYGEYDMPMQKKLVQDWKKNEFHAEFLIFSNAGHCVNLDVPDEFNKVLDSFWSTI